MRDIYFVGRIKTVVYPGKIRLRLFRHYHLFGRIKTFAYCMVIAFLFFESNGNVLAGECVWNGVRRMVAVGDVHGDFGQLVAVLRSANLIDSNMKWSGGKTHLIQLGDLPDRGPDTRKVMDLLMQLEQQAARAGGAVHALIGNHEAMSVYGDFRYVTPEDYANFCDDNSEKVRDAFYEMHLKELAADANRVGKIKPDDAYRKDWDAKHPLGYFERRYQFGPHGKYGKWIMSHNTVIQINDTIFVHGGISPKYADIGFDVINSRIRDELKDFDKLKGGIATDPEGPLWYRGLAQDDEKSLEVPLEQLLNQHAAKRIVIGHTPTEGAIIPRFSGRVIMVDVGLSAFYGSHLACLVIEGDNVYALHRGRKLEIPSEPGLPLLQYLKEAAALDPSPSPLSGRILQLEEQLAIPSGQKP
jgi:hypothetical protein